MKCNCDLRTKLVGDGCAICNPEYYERIGNELTAELTDEELALYGKGEPMTVEELSAAVEEQCDVFRRRIARRYGQEATDGKK